MKLFRSSSLPLLIYILVMLLGGVAAKHYYDYRAERVVYDPTFLVAPPPPSGAPGSHINLNHENRRMGEYDVLEIGNLRIATAISRRHYGSSGSGNFSSRIPDPADPGSKTTQRLELAGIPIEVVNCEVELGGTKYSALGPKRLVIIDPSGDVIEEVALTD